MGELAMVDYYEELSLVKESDIKHIQEELVRLESLWHKREVNSPEKANKMLGIIMDAQKVFVSEVSRKKYDSDLEASRRELEDPDVLRSKSLEKWTGQARSFFNDGQYDLAKAAIDNALYYVENSSNNGDLFHLAASIYLENNEFLSSMEYINKAIVSSPEWSVYYVTKAQIFEKKSQFEQQYDKRRHDISECRKNLRIAVSKAQAGGDKNEEGAALGMLAFSLYFQSDPDMALAEEYAYRAKKLGEHVNSANVLESIAERKNTPIYKEAEKEKEYGNLEHLQKALELYKSLGDWRDASFKASVCRTRIRLLEEEEVRRQQKEKRLYEERERKAREEREAKERRAKAELEAQRKEKEETIKLIKSVTPIAVVMVVVIVVVFGLINSFLYHKCGNNLKWNYDADTKVLTITGTGSMYDWKKLHWKSDPSLCNEIKTIIIEDGCTRISEDAFGHFEELTHVKIPNSVSSIGDYAFFFCDDLNEIAIPLSVDYIGQNAFIGCKEDLVIYYSGTRDQWLSFANNLAFDGVVECSDGSYRY